MCTRTQTDLYLQKNKIKIVAQVATAFMIHGAAVFIEIMNVAQLRH